MPDSPDSPDMPDSPEQPGENLPPDFDDDGYPTKGTRTGQATGELHAVYDRNETHPFSISIYAELGDWAADVTVRCKDEEDVRDIFQAATRGMREALPVVDG